MYNNVMMISNPKQTKRNEEKRMMSYLIQQAKAHRRAPSGASDGYETPCQGVYSKIRGCN
jgi:hypothetical protein